MDVLVKADSVDSALQFVADPSLTRALRVGYHDTDQTLHTPMNQNSQMLWNASGDIAKQFGDSTPTAPVPKVVLVDRFTAATHHRSILLSAGAYYSVCDGPQAAKLCSGRLRSR